MPPTDPNAPERTLAQRRDALRKANTIRTTRARWKHDIKAGRASALSPRRMIVSPPWWAESMKVIDLLIAIPRVGRVKAGRYLVSTQTAPSKTLGGLSLRQRRELAELLPTRRDARPDEEQRAAARRVA